MQLPRVSSLKSMSVVRLSAVLTIATLAVVAALAARHQPAHAQGSGTTPRAFQVTLRYNLTPNSRVGDPINAPDQTFEIPAGMRLRIGRVSAQGFAKDDELLAFEVSTFVGGVPANHRLMGLEERNVPGSTKFWLLSDAGGGIFAEAPVVIVTVRRLRQTGSFMQFDLAVSGELEPISGG